MDVPATVHEDALTYNVIAETPGGNENLTIVVGSHLDGVKEGSGINDNGSGSCANLELAISTARNCSPNQKIVFAWWGAEELGLIGSEFYVRSLTPQQRSKIALNLNYDMLGSPNFGIFTFRGTTAPIPIQRNSELIQKQFEEYFTQNGIKYELIPFDYTSDYGSFLKYSIPAGGLETGSGKLKTYDQMKKFGGISNVAFDVCYHASCDTIKNIHEDVLETNLHAAAYVLQKLAVDSQLSTTISQRNVNSNNAINSESKIEKKGRNR